MAGLLGDVLPYVYSRSNALARHLGGLLADPIGSANQSMGLLADKSRENQNMLAQAFQDPQINHNKMLVEIINAVSPADLEPVNDFGMAELGRGGLPQLRA